MVGGPSSKIFWKRLWVEQSRPLRATALPCCDRKRSEKTTRI